MAVEVPTMFAAFGEHARTEQMGDLSVHVLGPASYVRGQRANPITASLLSEIRRADIIHCHQQHILASSLASLACRLTGRKVFVSDLGGGGWDVSSYMSTDRWYHGHLHISEYSRSVFGHTGKPWAHVIYGGVDTAKFSPSGQVQKDGSVLFVGRLLPHKGVDDLIKAVPTDMPLEIIGRPTNERYFQDLNALADGKQVAFRTACSDQQIIEAYRRASCIVLPSVYQTMYGDKSNVPELLGQTLLEGMACETPAICTDVASMPEVVEDQVTGFVVPPNRPDLLCEKLLWMRAHPAETKAMGVAARRHVLEKFTWPTVVRRCLDIYNARS
jgi:glycosyltransferase involved in cell wall biosynthesis